MFRKKRREDEMRGQRFGMTRWIWTDLMAAGQRDFLRRLDADLKRSARVYGPQRTVLD